MCLKIVGVAGQGMHKLHWVAVTVLGAVMLGIVTDEE